MGHKNPWFQVFDFISYTCWIQHVLRNLVPKNFRKSTFKGWDEVTANQTNTGTGSKAISGQKNFEKWGGVPM